MPAAVVDARVEGPGGSCGGTRSASGAPTDATPARKHIYRPDVDGLRAVAVLAVVLFHYHPAACPGGFVGVDVFFVISGYLITGILLRRHSTGTFSYADFYARRVRRIFPTLLVVLVATLLASCFLMENQQYQALGTMTAYSAAMGANVRAIINDATAADHEEDAYWGHLEPEAGDEEDALLHLWSLGIEEQFYVFWPMLVPVLSRLEGRRQMAGLLVVLLASFGCSLGLSYESEHSFAYYLPFSRAWELLVGAVPAWADTLEWGACAARCPAHGDGAAATNTRRARRRHEGQAALGLALIAIALGVTNDGTMFPGWIAWLPTLGAALLVAAPATTIVGKILGNRVFVAIGKVSYPLYLFHWPVLVLGRMHSWRSDGGAGLGAGGLVACFVVSAACALATLKLVEDPLRKTKNHRTPHALALAMVVVFVFGCAVGEGWLPSQANTHDVDNDAGASSCATSLGEYKPCPHIVKHHMCPDQFYNMSCTDSGRITTVPPKLLGKSILVLGDSLPWQMSMSLKCAAGANMTTVFRAMHLFPIGERDFEAALDQMIAQGEFVAVVVGIGTWYSWAFNESTATVNANTITAATTGLMLNERCPESLQTHMAATPYAKESVYERAMRIRKECPALLGQEAYLSGLMRLRNVVGRNTQWPPVLWKDIPPQHWPTPSGQDDWAGPEKKESCVPVPDAALAYTRNRLADEALGGMLHFVRTWDHDLPMWDAHIGASTGRDCTHYCNPSPVTMNWVNATFAAVLDALQTRRR